MKIAIGTAQFGLSYGVANIRGQVLQDEAGEILDYASMHGVDTLDTAIAYGESEERLGKIGVRNWQVVSKLPTIPEAVTDISGWVYESVAESLERLQVSKLKGLLLHRSQELLSSRGENLYQALVALKDQGMVEKIGISIYSPEELDALWPHFSFDLVQAPYNVIDRRLAASGWLSRMYKSGVEVHTRSAFLQGLLLMGQAERPTVFNSWKSIWDQWEEWLEEHRVSPLQACLAFALSQPEVSRVVVGVDSMRHLQEIISSISTSVIIPPVNLCSVDENLINPSRWSLL